MDEPEMPKQHQTILDAREGKSTCPFCGEEGEPDSSPEVDPDEYGRVLRWMICLSEEDEDHSWYEVYTFAEVVEDFKNSMIPLYN